jgi:hypothetical protein
MAHGRNPRAPRHLDRSVLEVHRADEFGGEDGSRADVDYLVDLYIPRLVAAFPDKPLVVHFHNDFGLGAYNTVRALHHGATIPTCTVNGLGERAGNAPLHTTVMILKKALVSQHLEGVKAYYSHLERLGLTEDDLIAYALVLGREPEQAAR